MPASSKILNTNLGVGFQRHRKYDTDLDRLGRMKTAQSELRKTGELNLQKELRKSMSTYSVKRFSKISQRNYGMGDVAGGVVNGVRDVTGNVVEGAGKVIESTPGKLAGAVGGGMIGAKLGGLGAVTALGPLGLLAAPIAMGGGALLGSMAGWSAAKTAGNTLKNVGQDIHT